MDRPPRDTPNMGRGVIIALAVTVVALVLALGAAAAAARPVSGGKALAAHPHGHFAHVCGPVNPHFGRCDADVVTDASGTPFVTSAPAGYGPSDLLSAYALASAAAQNGSGETVAIVDAYDDPNAEADLGVYRSEYGLSACTTGNGCFRKVNQTGGTTYPTGNVGWSEEISLDLDMVSAICPNCHILLVEATNNSLANLAAAVDEAATLGATQISNSYGGSEYSTETSDQSNYNHPGIAITASSGDGGYGVEFPAASQYVTAVGGTSLTTATNARGWTETAWSGAGSGCSAYVTKPSWQKDTGCPRRTVADVSADADPNTGVAVYDTYGKGGWLVFGGTSVASPIIASYYALIGSAAGANNGSWAYNHTSMFNDVTSGSNGSCGGSYLCTAEVGYDGPTGVGTPEGVPLAPTVTTGSSSGVGTTTATVAGTVNPNGQSTTYQFDYGTSTSYGSQAPAPPDPSAGSGTTDQNESASLTGLTPGKMYHYRIEATNATGTTYGSDGTFTTAAAGPTLIESPSSVSPGRSVTITWSGVSSPTSSDWIGIYQQGAPNGSYLDWFYDNTCSYSQGSGSLASGSCSYAVPSLGAGTYEFRLFSSNGGYTLLATSGTFTLSAGATLSESPSSVSPGQSVTVTWSGVPSATSSDWVGVYQHGAPNGSYSDWFYDNTCSYSQGSSSLASGSCSYKLPNLGAGTYEFRLFSSNGGYTLLASSGTFTLSAGATLTESPSSASPGQSVTVTWSGVPNATSGDWIGIYQQGASNGSYLDWFYDNTCSYSQGSGSQASGSCSYAVPSLGAGTYQFRLFSSNGGYTLLAASNTFTLTAGATLTEGPSSASSGQSVTVTWSGVPAPTSSDWVGLYQQGAPNGSYLDWFYDNTCSYSQGSNSLASGSCLYKLPTLSAGTYEFRLFSSNSGYTLLATSSTFTVT